MTITLPIVDPAAGYMPADMAAALRARAEMLASGLIAAGYEDVDIVCGGSAAGRSYYVRAIKWSGDRRRYRMHDIRVSDHDCGFGRQHTGYFSESSAAAEIAAWLAADTASLERLG